MIWKNDVTQKSFWSTKYASEKPQKKREKEEKDTIKPGRDTKVNLFVWLI